MGSDVKFSAWDQRSRDAVGSCLREARKRRGLLQSEVAMRVGVWPSSISSFERGDRMPTLPIYLALSEVLGPELLSETRDRLKGMAVDRCDNMGEGNGETV